MASPVKVYLLHNSSSFAEIETKADTIRELREEQGLGGATINVNRVVVGDDHAIEAGMHIAAVTSNKTGG
jgi:hypothetical protein